MSLSSSVNLQTNRKSERILARKSEIYTVRGFYRDIYKYKYEENIVTTCENILTACYNIAFIRVERKYYEPMRFHDSTPRFIIKILVKPPDSIKYFRRINPGENIPYYHTRANSYINRNGEYYRCKIYLCTRFIHFLHHQSIYWVTLARESFSNLLPQHWLIRNLKYNEKPHPVDLAILWFIIKHRVIADVGMKLACFNLWYGRFLIACGSDTDKLIHPNDRGTWQRLHYI